MKITEDELSSWIAGRQLAIILFKARGCGVCAVHQHRLMLLSQNHQVGLKVVEMTKNPQIASSQMVLSAPVTKLFHNGKEIFKEGAYADYEELENLIIRLKSE